MNLLNYVSIVPNCIQDNLVSLFLSLPKDISPAKVGINEKGKVNTTSRVTYWICLPSDIITNVSYAIENLYNNRLKYTFEKPIQSIESPQLLYYIKGGMYTAHNDSEDFVNGKLKQVAERDVTILLYLNDDYEGGELEFVNLGLKIKPKAKTLIAFPSYIEYTHRVHPVISGERYTIVSWIKTKEPIYHRPW